MSLLHFHLNKVMLQHEVPRYFPLQPEQSRKEAKAKVSSITGACIKASGAGLNREAAKAKAAQPDYSHERIPKTLKEIEHEKLMASNVLQVEVRPSDKRIICDSIARIFCDYGDISVKKASENIFWVDFEHFEQREIDNIKFAAKNAGNKECLVTNLDKIKHAVLKQEKGVIAEIRYFHEAKRYPYNEWKSVA